MVRKESELVDAFQTATSEAKASFGNGSLLIEKLVERPRHVEIQVFGDGFVMYFYFLFFFPYLSNF